MDTPEEQETTPETPPKREPFEVTEYNWKPKYTKLIAYVQRGLPDEKLGELVGLSPATVSRIRISPYFKERLNHAMIEYEKKRAKNLANWHDTDKTLGKLEKAAAKAASVLIKSMRGKGDITSQQIASAKDILDRTGYKAREKLDIKQTFERIYSPEEIASAQGTMQEVEHMLGRLSSTGTEYLIRAAAKRIEDNSDEEEDGEEEIEEELAEKGSGDSPNETTIEDNSGSIVSPDETTEDELDDLEDDLEDDDDDDDDEDEEDEESPIQTS
jgi:hypothetical protein